MGFLAPLLAMTFAVYAFGGIEFVAVSSGEARSPQEIANATRITFTMLAILYIGAMVILVGVMPWNRAGSSESPFVTVFRLVNIPAAGHLMNFVVLTAALSGANAALYVSSRMLFSMARTGWAPAALGKLNKQGSPKLAVIVSAYGILVALALERWAPRNAFEFILRAAFFGMILSWVVSLAAHFAFRLRATPAQIRALPLHSPLGAWGSAVGFAVICAVILKGWWDSRVNLVSGLLYLLLLTTAWWIIKRVRKPGI
jgi:L-asparagine transporter-like permease